MQFDRLTFSLLVEKMDRNQITLAEVKAHCARYGLKLQARTKAQAIKEMRAALA